MSKRFIGLLFMLFAMALNILAGNGPSKPAEPGSPAGYSVPRYCVKKNKYMPRPAAKVTPKEVDAGRVGVFSVVGVGGTQITTFYLPVDGGAASLKLQQEGAERLAVLGIAKTGERKGTETAVVDKGKRRVQIPVPRYFTFEGYGDDEEPATARTSASGASSVEVLPREDYVELWLKTRDALISFGNDLYALREILHHALQVFIAKALCERGYHSTQLDLIDEKIQGYQRMEAVYKALLQKEARELWFGEVEERMFVTSPARSSELNARLLSLIDLVEGSFDFLLQPTCRTCSRVFDAVNASTMCCFASVVVPGDDFFDVSLRSLYALSEVVKNQQAILRACLQKLRAEE